MQNTSDRRAQFYTSGQSKEIVNVGSFTDMQFKKFRNVTVNGVKLSLKKQETFQMPIPIFRLADASMPMQ
jgi:hypothetical protein